MSTIQSPARERAQQTVMLAVGLLVSLACGCAVDSDMTVCGPGREVRDGVCADVIDPAEVVCVDAQEEGADIVQGAAGAPCVSWRDCTPENYCGAPGPEDLRQCRARCDAPSAQPCLPGTVCSQAGLCLSVGAGALGDDCAPGGCADGLACAAEDGVCRTTCDPRAEPACPDGELCAPRASGLGVCLPSC
jgi:hypothetical protein